MSKPAEPLNHLLDAVDDLTLPSKRRERQDILETFEVEVEIDGFNVKVERQRKIGEKIVTVVQEPLLDQLVKAIHSDIGSSARGASLAFERSILDADALFKFIKIGSATGDWCRMAGIQSTRNPTKDLRAWYVATLAHPLEDAKRRLRVEEMREWASFIRSKLNPFREWDLPHACPECGAIEWWAETDDLEKPGRLRPLIVRYKPIGAETIDKAKALCRACRTVWSVRALAYDIEQAAKANKVTA